MKSKVICAGYLIAIVVVGIVVSTISSKRIPSIVNPAADEYIGVYTCHRCDDWFTSWTDFCPNCGNPTGDEDLIQTMPYCSECGKKNRNFSEHFCPDCGGRLMNNTKIPLYEIEDESIWRWAKQL